MPELPDVLLYVSALERLLRGATIRQLHIRSPFVLRTFEPDPSNIDGKCIEGFSHRGKRIVWHLEGDRHLVFHPMVAGRFHWKTKDVRPTGKNDLLAVATDCGTLMFTEASSKKRAGLWILCSLDAVNALDPGGLDVLTCTTAEFRERLQSENNTLKRALADPRRFTGIGNAYGDKILHAARLSPLRKTQQLSDEEVVKLHNAVRQCLTEWIERLAKKWGDKFPEKVTAFHPEMAVHGKFDQPCPVCAAPVQRIRYADNECNYCARCQTGGRVLADRSLSRLLKDNWPRNIDELES